jgi:cytochrome P450
VLQYAAHHSQSNWSRPEDFVPERWLEGRPVEFGSDARSVFQPFSVGPRNCIGKNLAYMEMRLILARLVWNFDISLNSQSTEWLEQKIFFLWDKPALWIDLDRKWKTESALDAGDSHRIGDLQTRKR